MNEVSVFMLNVVMLNVIMLNAVAPLDEVCLMLTKSRLANHKQLCFVLKNTNTKDKKGGGGNISTMSN